VKKKKEADKPLEDDADYLDKNTLALIDLIAEIIVEATLRERDDLNLPAPPAKKK
jgi:hypothetical protein